VIEPLSADFHLVIPSLPGFGFSGPTTETGWDVVRIAKAWTELMRRLGYERYGAHGGWGGAIHPGGGPDRPRARRRRARHDARHPPNADVSDLTKEEQRRVGAVVRFQQELSGYLMLQAQRPQTVAYALNDSPVGQLAWIVEKFKEWTDSRTVPEECVDRDQMLTDVMLYWLTGTAGSSARLYREAAAYWYTPPLPWLLHPGEVAASVELGPPALDCSAPDGKIMCNAVVFTDLLFQYFPLEVFCWHVSFRRRCRNRLLKERRFEMPSGGRLLPFAI